MSSNDTRDDGGPAFPAPDLGEMHLKDRSAYSGMTLRDYFAAEALDGVMGLVAARQHDLGIVRPSGADGIAYSAYEIADAMLKARQS